MWQAYKWTTRCKNYDVKYFEANRRLCNVNVAVKYFTISLSVDLHLRVHVACLHDALIFVCGAFLVVLFYFLQGVSIACYADALS